MERDRKKLERTTRAKTVIERTRESTLSLSLSLSLPLSLSLSLPLSISPGDGGLGELNRTERLAERVMEGELGEAERESDGDK